MKYDCLWYTNDNGQAALDLLERLPEDERRARNKDYGISMKYDGVPIPNASGTPANVGSFMVRCFFGQSSITNNTGTTTDPEKGTKFIPCTTLMDLEVLAHDDKGLPTLVGGRLKPGVFEQLQNSPEAKGERLTEKRPDPNRKPPKMLVSEWRSRWRDIAMRKYGYQATSNIQADEDLITSLALEGAHLPDWDGFCALLEAEWRAENKPYDPASYVPRPEPWQYEDLFNTYADFRSTIVQEAA